MLCFYSRNLEQEINLENEYSVACLRVTEGISLSGPEESTQWDFSV